MRVELCFVVVAVFFSIEGILGKPNDHSSVEKELLSMSEGLTRPLLEKAHDADTTLSKVMEEYNRKMRELDVKLASSSNGEGLKTDIDSCHELRSSMDQARTVADQAAVLAVQLAGDMSTVIINTKDCLNINIFSAINCSAHKLQDGRNIYISYKEEINKVEGELGKSMKQVFSELINCFQRVNS